MSKLISLAEAKTGDRYTIAELTCDNTQQLLGMGLRPGAVITVLHRSDRGAVMVALASSRFCINHELAQDIWLKAIDPVEANLRTAPIGARLRIVGYAPTHPAYKRKLLAMGLTPGTEKDSFLSIRKLAGLPKPKQPQQWSHCPLPNQWVPLEKVSCAALQLPKCSEYRLGSEE